VASTPSNQELSLLSIKNLTKTCPGGTRALRGVSLESIGRNERAAEEVARGKAQAQHRKFDPGIRGQFEATLAGVDPYNKRIDRNPDDNIAVEEKK